MSELATKKIIEWLKIPLLATILAWINSVIFVEIYNHTSEKYLDKIVIPSTTWFFIGFFIVFFSNFLIINKYRKKLFNTIPYRLTIALINFLLVTVTFILLFGQLNNVEKIKLQDSNKNEYNLLVANIPYEVKVANPLQGEKNIVLEEKNKINVLLNLDDNSKGKETLPDNIKIYSKFTPIANTNILLEILLIFSITPPRLLLPIFVNKKTDETN